MENKDAVALIEGIDDGDFSTNKWEEEFMQSMRDLVDNGGDLTVKQGACLEKIYRKSSGGGDYQDRQRF